MEEVRAPHILSGCTLVRAAGLALGRKSPAFAQVGRLPNASGASPHVSDWVRCWAGTPRARLSKPSFLTHALSLRRHAQPRPTDSAPGAADLHRLHVRR